MDIVLHFKSKKRREDDGKLIPEALGEKFLTLTPSSLLCNLYLQRK
jgi:hypothetical protein